MKSAGPVAALLAVALAAGLAVWLWRTPPATWRGSGGPASRPAAPLPERAPPPRRSLGIQVQPGEGEGVRVVAVLPGGSGARAGLRPGDAIVRVEGNPIRDPRPLLARLAALQDGEVLTLEVRREGGAVETVVVRFEDGAGYEQAFARDLIRKAAEQLIDARRPDGLWPHYQNPDRPSVAVTALAAYALARAREDLDEIGREELHSTLLVLQRHLGPDGGLEDPSQLVPHRVYASALYACALAELPSGNARILAGLGRWLTRAQVQEEGGYDPIDPRYGGWPYYDGDGAPLRADVSTARFALLGLAAAELPAEHPAWGRAALFLDELQNFSFITAPGDPLRATERSLRDGGFCFTPRSGKAGASELGQDLLVGRSYGTATADGLLGLLAVRGVDRRTRKDAALPEDPRVRAALRWLAARISFADVPGFPEGSGWREGLYFYYLAAWAEAFHRAGVWEVLGARGGVDRWAASLVRALGDLFGRSGGIFRSRSPLMHEDAPGLAPALAIVALSAARDRLALGGGARLRVTRAVPLGPERHPPDPPPLPPRAARGWELARGRLGCFACHRDDGRGNGPSLVGVGERYLTRYGSTEEAGEALARFLRAPRPEASLAGGSWPARMPALSEVACSDEELGRLVDFLLSARGTRPVSELR